MEIRITSTIAALILATGCNLVNVPPDLGPCAKSGSFAIGATDWNGYHFPSGFKHPRVVDKTSGVYSSILGPVIASWNALGAPVDFSGASPWTIDVILGQPEKALGTAEVNIGPNGHIVSGRITMNPNAIAQAGLGPNGPTHILCQEAGHILGLGHERGMPDTCMNDCVGLGSRAEWIACLESDPGMTPNAADGAMLHAKYDHDDNEGDPGLKCQGRIVIHTFNDFGGDHDQG